MKQVVIALLVICALSAAGCGRSTAKAEWPAVDAGPGADGGTSVAELTKIEVVPDAVSVAPGETSPLLVQGSFSDGTVRDLTHAKDGTKYSSSAAATVTVSADGLLRGVKAGAATVTAENAGKKASTKVTVTSEKLVSISVVPAEVTLALNGSTQLAVTGRYDSGRQVDLTAAASGTVYKSSAARVATVGADGLVSAAGAGSAKVSVVNGTFAGVCLVNVESETLVGIAIAPKMLNLKGGDTGSFTVTGSYRSGRKIDLTSSAMGTVYSSVNPGIAAVSPEGGVEARQPGTTAVTASNSGFSDAATVNVAQGRYLVYISAIPHNLQLAVGATQALKVTGYYSDGTTGDLTYASAGTAYQAPSIVSVSDAGVVTALANGEGIITVSNGTLTDTVNVKVGGTATLVSLQITPSAITLQAGAMVYVQVTGFYSDGSAGDLTSAGSGTTYATTDAQIATVGANGDLRGVRKGATTLVARNSGLKAEASVTVLGGGVYLQKLDVQPSVMYLQVYASQQFKVIGYYSDGSSADLTSGGTGTSYYADSPVVSIDGNGVVTGNSRGTANVTVQNAGVVAGAEVIVQGGNAKLVSLSISPPSATMRVGDIIQLNVIGYYDDGSQQYLTQGSTGTWYQSTNYSVASVDGDGMVTAMGVGGAYIQATNGGVSASCQITVQGGNVKLTSIALTPKTVTLPWIQGYPGITYQMTVTGYYSDGSQRDLTFSGTAYKSDNPGVADVDQSGMVTAQSPGKAVIYAGNGGFNDSAVVQVTQEMPNSISCEPPSFTIAVGATQQLTVWANFPSGARTDVTHFNSPYAQTQYSSSSPSIASVDSGGLVRGATQGKAVITVTLFSFSTQCYASVTRSGRTLQYITVDPSYIEMGAGEVTQLSVTGYYSDGSTGDLTSSSTGTTYKSDQPWIADVSPDGAVVANQYGGPVNISVSNSGLYAVAQVYVGVVQPVVVDIRFTNAGPVSIPLLGGMPLPYQLYVVADYSDGSSQDITGSWSGIVYWSDDSGVATVDTEGVVNAQGQGSTFVYASYTDPGSGTTFQAEIQINVTRSRPVGLRVDPTSAVMFPGDTLQLTVYVRFQDGSELDVTHQSIQGQSVQYSSSASGTASVDGGGLVSALNFGSATITARLLMWRARCDIQVQGI